MKNVAILAVMLGVLGSAANAESAVSEAPEFTLAMNSNSATLWTVPATAGKTDNKALANQIELKANAHMEEMSDAISKQLEEKIAKELEYAMH